VIIAKNVRNLRRSILGATDKFCGKCERALRQTKCY